MQRKDIDSYIVERPWGRSEFLLEDEGYTVKRLFIYPGKRFSYQKHTRRTEQWTVAVGEAVAILDGKEIRLTEGESIIIPLGAAHRLGNPDKSKNLSVIEIQRGEYFGDDDTIRLEDDFGRS